MTETTVPTGRWAPIYAERLPLIASFDRLYADDFTPEDAAAVASWLEPFGPPEPTRADVEDAEVAGPHGVVPVRIYRHADGERSGAGLVWIHGGGFVNGGLDMPEADLVARGLVTRTHAVVVSVDYRLCRDGVHHPVPHDDCWAVYEYVAGHASELGIDPARIAVGGASAGGNLAASVALHGRDAGLVPWQSLLAYPVAHATLPEFSPELRNATRDMPRCLGFVERMRDMNENYLGGSLEEHARDRYAFPGEAHDLSGLPPTYIENCEFDDLRATGERYAAQLADAGVDVTVVTAAGVPHGHLNAIGSPLTAASLDRFATRLAMPRG
ncbi:MAG TPA: alpha/beta hydrolase [Propionibacteriaceae bacterium]|nr:alpha/beta hydrolase [Propionibacteriaceae bacterium]